MACLATETSSVPPGGVASKEGPPLAALALAREIRLLAPGLEPLVFPVSVPLPGSLLAYDSSIGE